MRRFVTKKDKSRVPRAEAGGNTAATNGKIGVGINLEFARHADKGLARGIKSAAKIGYEFKFP